MSFHLLSRIIFITLSVSLSPTPAPSTEQQKGETRIWSVGQRKLRRGITQPFLMIYVACFASTRDSYLTFSARVSQYVPAFGSASSLSLSAQIASSPLWDLDSPRRIWLIAAIVAILLSLLHCVLHCVNTLDGIIVVVIILAWSWERQNERKREREKKRGLRSDN